MIGDPELKVAKAYDMLPEGAGTTSRGPHRRRQRHGALGLHHRPRQEDQGDADLSDEHRPQLRRGAAPARLLPADGEAHGRDAGQLEAGEDVIIPPSVSDEQAKQKFPERLEDAEALPARGGAAEKLILPAHPAVDRPWCGRRINGRLAIGIDRGIRAGACKLLAAWWRTCSGAVPITCDLRPHAATVLMRQADDLVAFGRTSAL